MAAAAVRPPRSSALPLALAWTALIVYASLYPFGPWRVPASMDVLQMLELRAPPGSTSFDRWSNVLAYLPLGVLVFVAARGLGAPRALLLAVVGPAALSYALELTQTFLPGRVPSRLDLALNSGGAAAGAALGGLLERGGVLAAWRRWRERWFVGASAGVVALLLLWPVGLLFPAPVPFGLGQVFDRLRDLAEWLLADTPWMPLLHDWPIPVMFDRLSVPSEALAIVLGLLAPCLLAYTITRPGWRRLLLLAGSVGVGFAAMTFATALNFGPHNALTWLTPPVLPAAAGALAVGAALAWLPPRAVAGIGLVVVTALIVLVAQAPSDPYYAESLQAWEQGRFIRFHGAAQWVGWLWPFAALVLLLARVASRGEGT